MPVVSSQRPMTRPGGRPRRPGRPARRRGRTRARRASAGLARGRVGWQRHRAWIASSRRRRSGSRRPSGAPSHLPAYRSRTRPALTANWGSRREIQRRCCQGLSASPASHRPTVDAKGARCTEHPLGQPAGLQRTGGATCGPYRCTPPARRRSRRWPGRSPRPARSRRAAGPGTARAPTGPWPPARPRVPGIPPTGSPPARRLSRSCMSGAWVTSWGQSKRQLARLKKLVAAGIRPRSRMRPSS